MLKVRFSVMAVILLSFGFSSCENEVHINAPWKETIVVYGLLNPNDSVQYIKINKAFLNENISALTAAKTSDSLYLDSVNVRLICAATGQNILLKRTNEKLKDSGLFANNVNYLWKTHEPIYENQEYVLEVENPISKNKATARTVTIGKAKIAAPFMNVNAQYSFGVEYLVVNFKTGLNSNAYDVKFLVDYEEMNTDDTANTKKTRQIVWNIIRNAPVKPMSNYIYQVERTALLQFLANTIPASPKLLHRVKSVGIRIYGGNQALMDYISVNEPSIGIIQKQAEYSNITNWYGLFASRSSQEIWPVKIDPSSIYVLQTNPITKALNFIR